MTKEQIFTLIEIACKHRELDEADTNEYFCTNCDLKDYGHNPETPGEPWFPCGVDVCPIFNSSVDEV